LCLWLGLPGHGQAREYSATAPRSEHRLSTALRQLELSLAVDSPCPLALSLQRNPSNGDAVIVANLLEEYNRKLKEFEHFDVDHDGNLTEAELEAGLRAQQKSDREIKQMWERLELNEQGGVGSREYALMSIAV